MPETQLPTGVRPDRDLPFSERNLFRELNDAYPSIRLTDGFRDQATIDALREQGDNPSSTTRHRDGSTFDIGGFDDNTSLQQGADDLRQRFPGANVIFGDRDHRDHVHIDFPGYTGAPALGATAQRVGAVNPVDQLPEGLEMDAEPVPAAASTPVDTGFGVGTSLNQLEGEEISQGEVVIDGSTSNLEGDIVGGVNVDVNGEPITSDPTEDAIVGLENAHFGSEDDAGGRSFLSRLDDAFHDTASVGGRGVIGAFTRRVADWANIGVPTEWADLPPEEIERRHDLLIRRAAEEMRAEVERRQTADPAWRPDSTFIENMASGRWLPSLLGEILGDANPTYLIAPGATSLGRAASQGAVSAGVDLGIQAGEINEGLLTGIDTDRLLFNAAAGATFQGAFEVAGAVGRRIGRKGDGVSPDEVVPAAVARARREADAAEAVPEPAPSDSSLVVEDLAPLEGGPPQRTFEYTDANGNRVAAVASTLDDGKTLQIDFIGHPDGAGAVGPATLRGMLREVRRQFPEIESITGSRVSGARTGNTQDVEVDLPPQAGDAIPERARPSRTSDGQALRTGEQVNADARADREGPQKPVDIEDVVGRMTEALRGARRAGPEQERRRTAERSARLGAAEAAGRSVSGEGRTAAQLAALKGKLPTGDFESPRPNFTQRELDALADHVYNKSEGFDQINTSVALGRLLDGEIPSPSQMDLLARVLPPNFIKAAITRRNRGDRVIDALGDGLNVPRALMSSMDMSAPLRQALPLVNTLDFWRGIPGMFRYFVSQKAFRAMDAGIHKRPNAARARVAKVDFTRNAQDLTMREEAFQSTLAERIPVVGEGVKASERAYVGYLNRLRADTFDTMIRQARKAGFDVDDPTWLRGLGSYINNATGRGTFGRADNAISRATPLLNATFFSPRLMASRANLLNPLYYATLPPFVRRRAIRNSMATAALATTALSLAVAFGFDVETDMRSSDFGKIRNGTARYDVLGGFGQYLVLGHRIRTGESRTIAGETIELGEDFGGANELTVTGSFFRNKLSPLASYVADYLAGTNAVGDDFSFGESTAQRFAPMFLQDVIEVYRQDGVAGIPSVIPAMFGIGYQNFDSVPSESPLLIENNPEDPVVQELDQLNGINGGRIIGRPVDHVTIDGERINYTPEQIQQASENADDMILETLRTEMLTPDWAAASPEERIDIVNSIEAEMRGYARDDIGDPRDGLPAGEALLPTGLTVDQ